MKRLITSFVCAVIFWGCATANKISRVQIGMSQQDVIAVMGHPASTSAQGSTEYLNYSLSDTGNQAFNGITVPYFVRLINGTVESYGRVGDFNSTKDPTIKVKTEENISTHSNIKTSSDTDLYTELKKLKELKDEGLLTQDEFEKQRKETLGKYQ